MDMKKFFVLALSAAVALLASNVVASAQYLPSTLKHYKAGLMDEKGHVLTDQEVLYALGDEDYNETYRGAVTQYKAGNALMITGIATAATGLVGTVAGAWATDYGVRTNHIKIGEVNGKKTITEADSKGVLAIAGLVAGATLLTAGVTCLAVGIPLKSIGTKRLNWLADDYNKDVAYLRFGAGEYGTGLVLNF